MYLIKNKFEVMKIIKDFPSKIWHLAVDIDIYS